MESRVKHPLIRLGILRKASLVRASLAIVAVAGSYFSWQFIVTLFLQDTLGWSPLELALALLPVGLMVAASAAVSIVGALVAASALIPRRAAPPVDEPDLAVSPEPEYAAPAA